MVKKLFCWKDLQNFFNMKKYICFFAAFFDLDVRTNLYCSQQYFFSSNTHSFSILLCVCEFVCMILYVCVDICVCVCFFMCMILFTCVCVCVRESVLVHTQSDFNFLEWTLKILTKKIFFNCNWKKTKHDYDV